MHVLEQVGPAGSRHGIRCVVDVTILGDVAEVVDRSEGRHQLVVSGTGDSDTDLRDIWIHGSRDSDQIVRVGELLHSLAESVGNGRRWVLELIELVVCLGVEELHKDAVWIGKDERQSHIGVDSDVHEDWTWQDGHGWLGDRTEDWWSWES